MSARASVSMYALNRGVVSPLALGRQDVKRLALSAETQTNWMPRTLGPMALRVGWKYIGATLTNAASRFLKFIFATDDTALLEFTDLFLRIWIDDALLTRPAVSTAITNGTFSGSLAGWTDLDEAGAASTYFTGGGLEFMKLVGTGTARAIREQQVTVAPADVGVEHGIRIKVFSGGLAATLRIGSTSGADDLLTETTLDAGTHSLSITPTGDFFIRFSSRAAARVLVQSCTIEAAGVVSIPTGYALPQLGAIRSDQSGDVVYLACADLQPQKIERRGTRPHARSWSIVRYAPIDGPFNVQNLTPTTLQASALTGDITVTASDDMFRASDVGSLFSITSTGQSVTATGAANGVTTSSIRVTGIGAERTFSIDISGDATVSTVDLQRSYDNASWANVGAPEQWTANVTTTYTDALDNQIVFYRLILTTRVAPDSVTMALRIGSGSVRGTVRMIEFTSSTAMQAQVLSDLGSVNAEANWQEGKWSDRRGWPTAVRLHEGRLWWAGLNGVWGSISDSFESFDETFIGDAGPINRTIGSGPVDDVNWILSLKGMLLGTDGAEWVVRASTLDEPLTPTNFNLRNPSTQGSGSVEAIKADSNGYFVNRSGVKLFALSFSLSSYDYTANDLMQAYPDLGLPGIVRLDVQRLPDTRIHCVRSDGTAIVAVSGPPDEPPAWIPITTNGDIEDVVVLPALDGDTDDQVYYVVKRTINGSTVRYLEKWAQESDCQGGQLNLQADAFATYSGAAATVITGLDHLEGEEVVVWADGADVGTNDTARPWTQIYTVAGGQITLAVAASNVVVGLGYSAQFKSTKLGLQLPGAGPLNRTKTIGHIGLLLLNTHKRGLKFGPVLDDTGSQLMDDMPAVEGGTTIATEVPASYDQQFIEFPGTWSTDSRVCLQAQAPRPATVVAVSIEMVQSLKGHE